MNTFFSILSASIRPESGEKIALGLLFSDGVSSIFNYSHHKLGVTRSLVGDNQIKFIRKYLSSIQKTLVKIDPNTPQASIEFADIDKNLVINEPYIDYLSVYNQNVLVFSKPVRIDLQVTRQNYDRLFEKYIDPEKAPPQRSTKSIAKIKDAFLPTVAEFFTEEKEITEKEYPLLVMPVKIDLFGKNKRPVFAQFIDLEREIRFIKNDYFDLTQLKTIFNNGYGFLVTAEPNKQKFFPQHDIWNHLKTLSNFDFTDISEVEKIKHYAETHEIRPE